MSIPVYGVDPDWSLLYFTVPGIEGRFPVNPDEVMTPGGSLVLAKGSDKLSWTYQNMDQLMGSLLNLANLELVTGSSKIYSVHPTRVFLRLIKWAYMRYPGAKGHDINYNYMVRDLVEGFNDPAVMTFREREDFSAAAVSRWLGLQPKPPFENDPTTSILIQLCQLL